LEVSMSECGLTNLASCIPEKIVEFILLILNSMVQPFLSLTKTLLSLPVEISLFNGLWKIIIYVLSTFYGLLFLYCGFNFIISGYDTAKRENAKRWLRNIIIMIVLLQASYFLYETIIDLSSFMTAGVIGMINENLFLFNPEGLTQAMNIGVVILIMAYVSVLFFTILLLLIRYIFVSVGVVFFTIAIFLYYIPPIRAFGSKILYAIMVNIFIPFIVTIILLASAKITELPAFVEYRIIVMTASFLLVDAVIIYLMYSIVTQSNTIQSVKTVVVQAYTGISSHNSNPQQSLKKYM
jgi:hypothetical protein